MAFCIKCGNQLANGQMFCTNCGSSVNNAQVPPSQVPPSQVTYAQQTHYAAPATPAAPAEQDSDSFGWLCLGFCVPMAGLILYLLWNKEFPRKAKKAGLGALISVVGSVVFYILYIAFFVVFAALMSY